MRKSLYILFACSIIVIIGLFGWRSLPIEGETRNLFFASGRIPNEVRCLLDVDNLEFMSFSKLTDEVKTSYILRFISKPGFETNLLDSSLANSNWIFSHEMTLMGERVRYYQNRDAGFERKIIATIQDRQVTVSYTLPH